MIIKKPKTCGECRYWSGNDPQHIALRNGHQAYHGVCNRNERSGNQPFDAIACKNGDLPAYEKYQKAIVYYKDHPDQFKIVLEGSQQELILMTDWETYDRIYRLLGKEPDSIQTHVEPPDT